MSEPKNDPIKGLAILIICCMIVWGISWWATIYFIEGWQNRSAFGEMFGSVNTLFSGAALAGVIYAIFLQRRELQLQRRELEMTREEMARSAKAQEESAEVFREHYWIMLMTSRINAISTMLETDRNELEQLQGQGDLGLERREYREMPHSIGLSGRPLGFRC
jgi:hypothetical protein